jgi:polyhydroxybutyrate depolymerase
LRRGRRSLAALLLAVACGRGLPDPGADERAALAAAARVPSLPSAGCHPGELPAVRGVRRRILVSGEHRRFIVDAPAAPADRPLPVVLSFHGFRGNASGQRWWTGWGRLARRAGFIAIHPEGHRGVRLLNTTGRGWDLMPTETRDAAFVRALLDALEAERCVDRRRVFATGMSNGGFFANLLGCELADRLAAIAPVAGGLDLRTCAPARPVAVLLVHGRADTVVRPVMVRGARDWWARADRCGAPAEHDGCEWFAECAADVVYCEGPQAHRWPGDATERIWRFFQAHPMR